MAHILPNQGGLDSLGTMRVRVYLVLLGCLLVGSAWAEDVNILDCGAVPDGTTLSTQAIQKAIDRCAAAGGGTVTVPAGRFLTNTVFLKSNVNLHLGQGAVLLGGTEPKAFTQAVVYANAIKLTGNDLTGVRNVVTLGQGCEDAAVKEWNNLK